MPPFRTSRGKPLPLGTARRLSPGGVTGSPPARVDRAGRMSSAEYESNRTLPSAKAKFAPPACGDQKWKASHGLLNVPGLKWYGPSSQVPR